MVEQVKAFLQSRRQAYRLVFGGHSPHQRAVLQDLHKFCRAGKSTFHADPRVAANLDGRREVWLRIAEHLNLTEDQLYNLYGKGGQ